MRIRNGLRKATNIHVERARHKITQQNLADKLSISRIEVINIESGKTVPNLRIGLQLAQLFNKTVEYLFNNY